MYPEKVNKVVKDDLASFLAGRMIKTKTTKSNEQISINSALFGPSIKGIKAYGHHWNINRANVKFEDGSIKVNGTIEHAIKGLKDDKLNYECEMKSGLANDPENIIKIKYKDNNIDRSYKKGASQMVKDICSDAWLEFSIDSR